MTSEQYEAALETMSNIVRMSGLNDMSEIIDALNSQRARIAELEAENARLRAALTKIKDRTHLVSNSLSTGSYPLLLVVHELAAEALKDGE